MSRIKLLEKRESDWLSFFAALLHWLRSSEKSA